MDEMVYRDVDPRYVAKNFVKIPLTFLGSGDIEAGTIIGIKANGYADKVKRSSLTSEAASGGKDIIVQSVSNFKVGDTASIIKADGTGLAACGLITAIDVNAKKVTVTDALGAAYSAGSFLFVSDGSEKAVGILSEPLVDTGSELTENIYVEGVFDATLVKGVDAFSLKDLNARLIKNILVL